MVSLVFLVAGISSRFDGNIKSFAMLGKKMLIEYSLEQALLCQFDNIIFIVSQKTRKPFYDKFGSSYEFNGKKIPIKYCEQSFDINTRNKPWGTVDALCTIYDYVDESFMVCNGDDIYGENSFRLGFDKLITTHDNYNICFRLRDTMPTTGTVNRGICCVDGDKIVDMIEMFDISFMTCDKLDSICSVNLLCLHKNVLDDLIIANEKFKNDNKNNKNIEHLLSQYLGNMIRQNNMIMKYCLSDEKFYGITRKEDVVDIMKQNPKIFEI